MAELPTKRQRRRLNYDKCQFCRNAKKACTPSTRTWPQKCDRCIELELECSENSRATGAPPLIASQPAGQAIKATQIQKSHDLSLRVTWLRQLKSYQKSVEAVAANYEKLFDYHHIFSVKREVASVTHLIENEEHSLFSDLLDESIFSNNPLGGLAALSLETTEVNHFRYHSQYPLQEIVDHLWKSGDIGTALSMQEYTLLHRCSRVSREVINAALQKYYDIYSEMIRRLEEIGRHTIPPIPALHNLLIKTQGKTKFPLDSIEEHLIPLKDYVGRSLLHVALDLEVEECVACLVQFDEALITEDNWGRWPIHIASSKNSESVASHFVEKGLNLDTEDAKGNSPLHYASTIKNETFVRILLARGVQVDCENTSGHTPLSLAAKNGHTAISWFLLQKGANIEKDTPLYRAAINGHTAIVQVLLENGADIERNAPLYWAAENGHTAVAQVLLKKGADVNCRGKWGGTPLLAAVKYRHMDTIRLLLEHGANPNIMNVRDLTPLDLATGKGYQDIVRILETTGHHRRHEELE